MFGDLMSYGSKDMFKNAIFWIWISWERNITFLWNKKNFNLCVRWDILRSYRFVAEVTFKLKFKAWKREAMAHKTPT